MPCLLSSLRRSRRWRSIFAVLSSLDETRAITFTTPGLEISRLVGRGIETITTSRGKSTHSIERLLVTRHLDRAARRALASLSDRRVGWYARAPGQLAR